MASDEFWASQFRCATRCHPGPRQPGRGHEVSRDPRSGSNAAQSAAPFANPASSSHSVNSPWVDADRPAAVRPVSEDDDTRRSRSGRRATSAPRRSAATRVAPPVDRLYVRRPDDVLAQRSQFGSLSADQHRYHAMSSRSLATATEGACRDRTAAGPYLPTRHVPCELFVQPRPNGPTDRPRLPCRMLIAC